MTLTQIISYYGSIPGVAGAVGALVILFLKWRMGFLRHSVKRTQRLYALTRKGAWRNADAPALQIAISNAIGGNLSADQIRIALERSDATRVLGHCKMAKGMVGVSEDKLNFVPKGRWKAAKHYRIAAAALYAAAFTSWPVASLVFTLFEPSKQLAVGVVASLVIATPFFTWLSACSEAAYQLTHDFDRCYPTFQPPAKTPAIVKPRIKESAPNTRTMKEKSESAKADPDSQD
ncbi:hypothetical protein NRY95_17390 [Xanthomonas campestris pv. phormiicola]|nr:hypothetical protein [Xanthomonas campestris pv. phormiicola]UYC15465.1 hypothetical protein NRY95_17390 [Xanthomonas campestris pv. phormiicola]